MGREVTKHTISQCEEILDYMRKHKGITQAEAVAKLNCYRLSARIYDLRKEGHNIKTKTIVSKKSNGTVYSYAFYFIEKGGNRMKNFEAWINGIIEGTGDIPIECYDCPAYEFCNKVLAQSTPNCKECPEIFKEWAEGEAK